MQPMKITDAIKTNFMPYSAYVITDRALPYIDGFKPSQRRILYTMMSMSLFKGARKKSQGIVGRTMFLHPHGDGAIYEAMVRMSRDAEALLIPYIDSKGNFGKHWSRDMKYASARYTEVRLEKIAEELFKDINNDAVDMVDNYDGELKEPTLLPVSFPNILTNPQSGTAVGMSNSFASYNLSEVIDYTVAYINNQNAIISDYIKAPDFPSGGNVIYDEIGFNKIFETGRGSYILRANHEFTDDSIIFTNLPYDSTIEVVMEKISSLVKLGKLKDIVDINDNTGINSSGVEVTVKKNANKELIAEQLFNSTPLQDSYPCNFNLIIDGKPKVLGVRDIVDQWVKFRAKTVKRSNQYKLDKAKKRFHHLEALKKVIVDVEATISIVRETKDNDKVVKNLMNALDIDEIQAEFVADIKLKHLNKEYLEKRIEEITILETEIHNLNEIVTSKRALANLIISQLEEIKEKYGEERKTNIIDISNTPKINLNEIIIDDYNLKIYLTKEGYLKKLPLTSLRGNFTIKLKDGDEIIKEIETTNNSDILVFTDKHNVYKYKTHEIDDHKPSSLGEYLPSLLNLKDEEILYTTVTNDYSGNLIIGFEDGKVAKIELSAYKTKQNRSMLKNAYSDKKALFFAHINEDIDILAISSIDKALVFNTSMINSKSSKTAQGNQVMKSKNDSVVVSYKQLEEVFEEAEYYRTANAGVGKYLKKRRFQTHLN